MGVLTTAGVAKYNAAIANNSFILVKKLVFGSNTGTVNANTTAIGTAVYSFDRVHLSSGFSAKSLAFSIYLELPNTSRFSQVGIYDDTNTLIAVERVNIPAATAEVPFQILTVTLTNLTNPEVFETLCSYPKLMANSKNAIKLYNNAASYFEQHVPGGIEGQIYKSTGSVLKPDWLLTQAAIVESASELDQAKNSIPNMEEIFNKWYRFSHKGTSGYPSSEAETQGWNLTANKDLYTTVNSDTYIGFVSPDKYINYELDVQISSTNADDDCATLVIAFNKENNEYTLSAVRDLGGFSTAWKLIYNLRQSGSLAQIEVANGADKVIWGDGLYHTTINNVVTPPYTQMGGWSRADRAIGVRVRITRNGDIITAQTSDFGSTTLIPDSLLSINMADFPFLSPLRKPASYGYGSLSQRYTYYKTTSFIDKENLILDIRDGKIYAFNGTDWVVTGQSAANSFGINKFVYSRVNKKTYYIKSNGVMERVI